MLRYVDDFETFSRRDLRDCNLYVYAAHESTGVHCMSYALPTGEVCLWRPGMEFPFADEWPNTKIVMAAFNAEFEIEIWNQVCTRLYGWPKLNPDNVECLQAKASYAGLPRKLDLVAKALGFGDLEKDKEGHGVMMRLARPQKAAGGIPAPVKTHGVLHGGKFDRDEFKIERVGRYCRNDDTTERLVDALLPSIPDDERKLWAVHRRINERGVPVDVALCRNASKLAHRERTKLGEELSKITGIPNTPKPAVNKLAKMKAWLESNKIRLTDMRKETIEDILTGENPVWASLPLDVRRALQIRQLCKDAAVSKYDGILCHVNERDTCQGAHVFYKAGPGRFAGAGVNFLNLKRLDPDRIEENLVLADRISQADEYEVGDIHSELSKTKMGVIPALGGMVRLAVCARPGKKLLVRDYKAIEMRVLHWLAGDERMLKAITDFDSGIGIEPYVLAAALIFRKKACDVTKAERNIGKVMILGGGYLSGAATFSAFCMGYGIDMPLDRAKTIMQLYRQSNPEVVKFWYALGKAAINAVKHPGKVFECGRVSYLMSGHTLTCLLPSGRELNYYAPKIVRGMYGNEIEAIDQRNGLRRTISLPTIVENVDQAISRDLLADALIKCDAERVPVVLHVYDEIVAEVDEDDDKIGDRLSDIMRDRPSWASDLPIDVDGGEACRYIK